MEAAPRDPAKLRNTAFVLIVIAVVGGIIIMAAYLLNLRRQEASGRPPHVARLESNFAAVNHDKTAVGLGSLEGKVWLLTTVCLGQAERSVENIRVMQAVAAKYPAETDLHFVCLTIDPNNDVPEKMAEFAKGLGLAEEPRWWFLAAGEEPTRGYLKDKLKFGAITEQTVDGKVVIGFDSVLGLVDNNRNLRGRYDFAAARKVQDETRQALAEHPGELEKLNEEHRAAMEQNREAVRFLEDHLLKAMEYVFNEKNGTLPEQP